MTLIRDALEQLGIDRLVCAVHERCFPADGAWDLGCGTIGGRSARDFVAFLAGLGFNGVQLGPAGEISLHDPSPYDGTAFSRNPLHVSWSALASDGVFDDAEPSPQASPTVERCDFARAFEESTRRWSKLHRRWEGRETGAGGRLAELQDQVVVFQRREAGWLVPGALHRVLSELHGTTDTARWPHQDAELFSNSSPSDASEQWAGPAAPRISALLERHAAEIERFAREQWLLLGQHLALREHAHGLDVSVWADLQVGLAHVDRWANARAILEGYVMGAPPSRTNPEGQPWGYPVLDPKRRPLALELLRARFRKLFREYDGVRVDHPHGLVCPWVYRASAADPFRAVRDGARLYSVGPRPDHAALAGFDIPRADQIDAAILPWSDGFVTDLEPRQVERYAWALDALVEAAQEAGRSASALACEVLSTMPYPLERVLARHGLGRFRITGKADVTDPADVYRVENSFPEDWIMPGTHDTAPLWRTVRSWSEETLSDRRAYAAQQLSPDGVGRTAMERYLAGSREALALAELALLFTGRARSISLWIADVMGSEELYNRPGLVHPDNWTLRVPSDYRALHTGRASRGAAFDPAAVLALALAAKRHDQRASQGGLVRALAARAMAPLPDLEPRLRPA